MQLNLTGLASGFDWMSVVNQLTELERTPQTRMRSEQTTLRNVNSAYAALQTQLEALQAKLDVLQAPGFFDTRAATVSDPDAAAATAGTGAPVGEFAFSVTQLATAAKQQGQADVGAALNATNDVSGLVLSAAPFGTAVTAGTFTVNGQQISIDTSDTLQAVFDRISTATGGAVTASYDSATDKITFSSAGEIVLGSATDTSNFLVAAKLHNNGTGTVTSRSALGVVQRSVALSSANFATPVTDGGSVAGEFKINGVSITFDAATDTVADVLARINNSSAGVVASYDAENDRFLLTNKVTGDLGIALEDVTGNFLAATGLSGGTLQRGQNLLYSINGGPTLVSQSNRITEESSGITDLSVDVSTNLATTPSPGQPLTFTVTVSNDTAAIKKAITEFVDQYNKTQSLIDTQTASSTDADGKVTLGVLAGDGYAEEAASRLRAILNGQVSGLSGTIWRLEQLGYTANGYDNNLALTDSEALDDALANNLSGVADLFTHEDTGLLAQLQSYLEGVIGDEGSLVTRQETVTEQVADLDEQIAAQERYVQSQREQMIQRFVVMERTQAQLNQQLQFLSQRLAGVGGA